ncbi:MAG: sensor histidine kinase [Bacteroidales bacterium]|jgi:two-component system phosphate regulon sensor histidine kinase PhoR|nr:sensor histidine kinase [Bacteroidales bacterium]
MQKNLSPLNVVLICNGVSILLLLLFEIVIFQIEPSTGYTLAWFLGIIAAFAVGVFVSYLLVNYFIFGHIKLIYKLIHEFRIGKIEPSNAFFLRKNILQDVEQETQSFIVQKQQEIKHLKELEQYRKEFLGNVAHELKTPLTAMQGYILTLLDGGLNEPTINELYLKRTASNIERMTEIVNDLVTITGLESEENSPKIERFNLTEIIEEVFNLLEMQAKNKHVSLQMKFSTEKQYPVLADKTLIIKVLINLIENSIKYNDKSEGLTTVSIFDVGENYLIEVADNGIGIEEQHFLRLFERFYRVDKNRSRSTGGSGLGLAIVKHILDAHHQSITVSSVPTKGATFGFTLKKG